MKQYYLLTFQILFTFFSIGQTSPVSDIIPRSSRQLTPFIFNDAKSFSDGYAAVEQNGKWGFIDLNGEIVIPCKYDKVKIFQNGIGAVYESGKWWLLNNKAEIASDAFESVNYYDNVVKAQKNGKWGAYDFELNLIVPHKFSYFHFYEPHFLRIQRGTGSIRNRFLGILSIEGDTIIPIEYKLVDYNDGVFLVQDDEQRQAYFDKEGKQQSKFSDQIMEVLPFNKGYGAICLMDGCKIMDSTFALLPKDFKSLGENCGSYFPLSQDGINWGIYDVVTNKWVIQPIYDEISIVNEKYISCSKSGTHGVLDFQGKEVIPFVSNDEITFLNNVAFLTSETGLKGAFCFKTGYMLPIEYQRVISDKTGRLLLCKKNGTWSVLNAKGQLIKANIQGVDLFPTVRQNRLKIRDENDNVGFILFE